MGPEASIDYCGKLASRCKSSRANVANINPWRWCLGTWDIWWSWCEEFLSPQSSFPCPAMQLWTKWFGGRSTCFFSCHLMGAQLWAPSAPWVRGPRKTSQTWHCAFCWVGGAGEKAPRTKLWKDVTRQMRKAGSFSSNACSFSLHIWWVKC